MNNKGNKKYKNIIEENELFEEYNLNISCFDNLEEAFDFILYSLDFKPLFINISRSLYPLLFPQIKGKYSFYKMSSYMYHIHLK